MSTNFYVTLYTDASRHNETEAAQNSNETVFHIGKRVNKGLAIVQGQHFPTVEAWKTFLLHNKHMVVVEDEYGTPFRSVEEFIAQEFSEPGTTQLDYLKKSPSEFPILDTPSPQQGAHWVNEGFLFYNGEFF